MRTTLWRYHLGGGCVLALAYVYLPFPALRIGALVALCLATIAATLAAIRLWRPARRERLFWGGGLDGHCATSLSAGRAPARSSVSLQGRSTRAPVCVVPVTTSSTKRSRRSIQDRPVPA